MTRYFINEEFTSVQGEGYWTGRTARFIRLQGCTVGCSWAVAEHTTLTIPGMRQIPIEDVTEGLVLLGRNNADGLVFSTVTKVYKPPPKAVLNITVERGTTIQVTPEHRLMVANGDYVRADRLRAGDYLMTSRSVSRQIAAIAPGPSDLRLFDVQTTTHNYIANGIVVHNCDSGPLADLTWGRHTNGLTRNTWGRGGVHKPVEEIVAGIDTHHVVVTGGEPTLYDLDELIYAIGPNHYIQLETSGQNDLKGNLAPDWVTWSPKQNLNWDAPERLRILTDEVKWVVDESLQWETVLDTWNWYLGRQPTPPYFFFMPEGCPPRKEMIDKTLKWLYDMKGLRMHEYFRFGDRLQYRLGIR